MIFRIALDDGTQVHLNIRGHVTRDADGDYEVEIRYPQHDGGDEVDAAIEAQWDEIETQFLAHYLQKHI